jgi:hypothetical protein
MRTRSQRTGLWRLVMGVALALMALGAAATAALSASDGGASDTVKRYP